MTPPALTAAGCRWLGLRGASDPRGSINFVEMDTDLDFPIRRAFWIHGVPAGQDRGHHAHRESRLLMVALSGGADVVLDDGQRRETVRLDRPDRGLICDAWVWHELHGFADGTVVLVLASTGYAESDYIRDYATFRREVGTRGAP
ncbi:WxcM-like domain-containing protein [Vineibacter terrae]|uniref:WxcM-like domain-containing protein n=1 Tax=Vineibacter terrae TaxID=2586908 RepID=A0A5C8PIX4_9HYPH|nr:FdtA/QdtA family cupin domain-containing protein [Vineibacter terrae]TXL73190.1 WxcM-like domain-containing protein [Vineibacter terrae]